MKLSLRWKILAWFFLNLVLIAAGVLWFLRSQFSVGIQSLLAGPTGVRLQAMAEMLSRDLATVPKSEWAAALTDATAPWRERGLRVAIFQNNGRFIVGDATDLPPEVSQLIAAYDTRRLSGGPGGHGWFPHPHGAPGKSFGSAPPNEPPRDFPKDAPRGELPFWRGPGPGTTPGEFTKFMVTSEHPRLYWAGVHLDSAAGSFGLPYTLVLSSDSIRGAGLFFDYVPWLWLGGAIALGSILLWLPFVHTLTRTVGRLTRSAEQIAAGQFEAPPETSRGDELGRLHNAHRLMAQRLEGYVTGQKRFLGDTAHELLSPLARLEVALSILENKAAVEDRAYTDRALEEVGHISKLIQELLAFSKTSFAASAAKLEPLPLAPLVGEAVNREAGDAKVVIEIRPSTRVLAAPALLSRAVGNVVRNAVRYAGTDGPIGIEASTHGDEVILTVADEGPGVPEDALPKIFDPFFRPDTSRTDATGGTGLGLAIVKTCIEACHGKVTARNRPTRGFEVTLSLSKA